MAKLAIKGHATRGKEVIEILEMLGGKNDIKYCGSETDYEYSINENGIIDWKLRLSDSSSTNIVFTLEEFLEDYPYKIGDKVLINDDGNDVYTVKSMMWNEEFNRVAYKIEAVDRIMQDNSNWFAHEMVFSNTEKEETMEERKYADLRLGLDQDDKLATEVTIDGNKITPPENYLIGKITQVDNGMLVEFVKKQPKYPKTYEECAKELGYNQVMPTDHVLGYKGTLLSCFQQLIICRDAYWKIAGEQMGLGKPWEPDYTDDNVKYIIGVHRNHSDLNFTIERNYILIFPTEEMRDAFYENFKDLIESCKELL